MMTALHQAIIGHLATELPGVHIGAYPLLRQKITTPAVLLEVQDISPAPKRDRGTEQLCLQVRLAARCIVETHDAAAGLKGLELALSVALLLHQGRRFGQRVGPALITSIDQDHFEPALLGYLIWRVEWSHELELGASVWDGGGLTPGEIYLGFAPRIGAAHQDDYLQVAAADIAGLQNP
ncbi:hypothetical protein [Desulfuromonas thiophila]|uniref:hypothetical protein n=1 Tax=Desulfuromonas thiophila TaxID=57664 RepID=UPI0029F5AC1B|nr:hypothetical protein [Desulfuromonas thiophila]